MSVLIVGSAPARADFLNTHQDYKGLPVVPVGLNLRTYLTARIVGSDFITVRSLDLEKRGEPSSDSFKAEMNEFRQKGFFGNYFRAVSNVLAKRERLGRMPGMEIAVQSEIPIGSGLASSAALEVAFAALLNYVGNLNMTPKELAETCYSAENEELRIPCGRLDQYGASFGGIIKLDCRPPFNVEPLSFRNLTFAIAYSGIRHSTLKVHSERQAEINRGLSILMEKNLPRPLRAKLGYSFDQPKWDEISEKEIKDSLTVLDEKAERRILFTLRMNRSTNFALKILRSQRISEAEIASNIGESGCNRISRAATAEREYFVLGEIMNEQHALLRDLYDLSLPQIEDMCVAALTAGAYGAKISGAGMGGSIITLVKDEDVGRRVVDACKCVGADNGWVSKVAEGARIEQSHD
jgi:galactokinase